MIIITIPSNLRSIFRIKDLLGIVFMEAPFITGYIN